MTRIKRACGRVLPRRPKKTLTLPVRPLTRWTKFWGLCAGAAIGVAAGGGLYTFVYARGFSYFSNDPAACANCHIMREHYDAWHRSSHRSVATCNDCHTPSGLLAKYLTKAENGFFHSLYFTTGDFPDPLRIRPRNHAVVEQACRKCHEPIAAAIEAHPGGGRLDCVRCHDGVGHPLR